MKRAAFAMLALALIAAGCSTMSRLSPWPDNAGELVVKQSPYSASETLDRLAAVVEERGGRVFARVDHAAGARAVGELLEPTEVLIFGNPRLGTPFMVLERTMGVDLPARALAWEEGGQTYLGYPNPVNLARRYDFNPDSSAVAQFAGALDALTDAAIAQ